MQSENMASIAPRIAEAIDEIPVAYLELDAEGRITKANRAACQMQKMTEAELLGRTPWQFMPGDEVEQSLGAFLKMIRKGEPSSVVRRSFYSAQGEFKTYEVHRSLMSNESGAVVGMRLVMFDVTEQVMEHEAAVNARNWLESVLASLNEAIVVTDALGFVREMNPAAEKLSGWSSKELIGKAIEKGLPILRYVSDGKQNHFRMGLDGPCKGRAIVMNRARQEMEVEINSAPILDPEHGFTTGVVSHWRLIEK